MTIARHEIPGTVLPGLPRPAGQDPLPGLPWQRAPRHGIWWIPDEAPGGLGSRELWMDCAAMDAYGRGDAAPAVTVSPASPGTWIDAIVRFDYYEGIVPDSVAPCVYIVDVRRTSPANLNRPYYVLKWPDLSDPWGRARGRTHG